MNKKLIMLILAGIIALGGVTYAGATVYLAGKKTETAKVSEMQAKLDAEKVRLAEERKKLEEETKKLTAPNEDEEKRKLEEENRKLEQAKADVKSKTVDYTQTTAFDKKINHSANIEINEYTGSNESARKRLVDDTVRDSKATLDMFKNIMDHFLNNSSADLSREQGTAQLEKFFKEAYKTTNNLKRLAKGGMPSGYIGWFKGKYNEYQNLIDDIDHGLIFNDNVQPRQVVDKKPDVINSVLSRISNYSCE